eukprot:gnl/MRDRNA2_/MRDRNA2_170900_c0_seq1.p1 gnl/MRDRNA2_/MRDRNA2_170900_c0~~gnl/MRDRNA2_/MRDRNA2_170900_c0_seq1.p1  ORF type:complete len:503 (-),score=65.26 gnl/MRDRNA2_/MRDRNA2_170900_c0_seq1:162-1670(-)
MANSEDREDSVAIIGAGPCGLAACKAALEEGLRPTVFEIAPGVGGLWRGDGFGKIWNSLHANLSKYTCAFSDAPWPNSSCDFPSGTQVQQYLEGYADENELSRYIRFHMKVTSVRRTGSQWYVSAEATGPRTGDSGDIVDQKFHHVIVASGIFSRPCRPVLPGIQRFQGKIVDAAAYREPGIFANQRVLVVGAAFSGADIASEIGATAKSAVISAKRPFWYLPRYIGGRPADLAFYSRAASDSNKNVSLDERNQRRNKFFASLVGEMPPPLITPQAERGDIPFVAITDNFVNAMKSGMVTARAAEVVAFDERGVRFSDGHREEFDTVLFATGYHLDLPFFSQDVLKVLEFEPDDLLQPVILHQCVWRPELPDLAFVGIYRGPYFAAMELQARWVCGVFSKRLPKPSWAEMELGLKEERRIRAEKPRPQFPHGDYVQLVETLSKHVGAYPVDILENTSDPLHSLLYDGPLLPFHYRLVGFGAKREVAEAAIKECAKRFPTPKL